MKASNSRGHRRASFNNWVLDVRKIRSAGTVSTARDVLEHKRRKSYIRGFLKGGTGDTRQGLNSKGDSVKERSIKHRPSEVA